MIRVQERLLKLTQIRGRIEKLLVFLLLKEFRVIKIITLSVHIPSRHLPAQR